MTAGGKRKVNKDNDYLKLFSKDGEDALTEKELSEIIEEELSKPEEKMNTELIESCLDEINRLKMGKTKGENFDGVKSNGKSRVSIKYLIAVATFFLISAFAVSATTTIIDLLNVFVELFKQN